MSGQTFRNCTNCAHLVNDELHGFRVCNRNGERVILLGARRGCGSDFQGWAEIPPKPPGFFSRIFFGKAMS